MRGSSDMSAVHGKPGIAPTVTCRGSGPRQRLRRFYAIYQETDFSISIYLRTLSTWCTGMNRIPLHGTSENPQLSM